jgi:ribosomal protein L16 Arg81 hydroxylase
MDYISFSIERKYSQVTEEFPDKTKFPLYYEAKRQEFILNEGEMLYIPAGWWHFVFSEEPNSESGINVAYNFWYDEPLDWKEGVSNEDKPEIKKHDLSKINPIDLLEDNYLTVYRSKDKYFPPNVLSHRFNNFKVEHMTYNEFLITRNPEYYILQNKCSKLIEYAPSFRSKIHYTSVWINYGNVYSLPHYDIKENYLCQIQGKRRVILFPPEERPNLYPINPYPVQLITDIDRAIITDRFILRRKNVLSNNLCTSILSSIPESIKNEELLKSYREDSIIFSEYLNERKCIDPLFTVVPDLFNIIDNRNKVYEEGRFDRPCIFLWFITDAKLEIRSFTLEMSQGEIIIFPVSFLYPWRVHDGVFAYPIFFHQQNQNKFV